MSLDGIAIRALAQDLKKNLLQAKVDKISQPDKNEILFHLRQPGQNLKLFGSIHPQSSRLCLTEAAYTNPSQPPLFCMVLRKHLVGAIIEDIVQPGWERILRIQLAGRDEIGDPATYHLLCELMGKSSNIILLNDQGTILDALRRVGAHTNTYRQIQPGLAYTPPPAQNKLDLEGLKEADLATIAYEDSSKRPMAKVLLQSIAGLGPQSAREICIRAGINPDDDASFLGEVDFIRLWETLQSLQNRLQQGGWEPTIILDHGDPIAFAPFPLLQMEGLEGQTFPHMSAMLQAYYEGKEAYHRTQQMENALRRRLKTEMDRAEKKLGFQLDTVAKAERAEKYRLYGELLTANLHAIKQGTEAQVINFYDPNQALITIPMKAEQSPNQNAQNYFKRYQKAQKGAGRAQEEAKKTQAEIAYLESITHSLDLAQSPDDLQDIRQELVQAGYAKAQTSSKKKKTKDPGPKPLHLVYQGYDIYVGKNNRQNDFVTFKVGRPKDLWLHTKDIHGAHVIVKAQGEEAFPPQVQSFAALLAAYFSKGRYSGQVPVDATLRKYVKKPSGAAPGMVIYTDQTTLFATPDESLLAPYLKKGDGPCTSK